ncbi:MAG: c-type cytochrome [Gammaproteobacteria bacterium]
MKRISNAKSLGLGAIVLAMSLGGAQADVSVLAKQCDSCHGQDGNSSDAVVPNIAGMSVSYLTETLVAFAEGDRPSPRYKPAGGDETDMGTVAKALSEAEVEAIASYYAGKTFARHEQPVDAGLAAAGKALFEDQCDRCHSDAGTVADDDSSLLLGQWKPYLKAQFEAFAAGARPLPKKMASRFNKLSDEDKAAILEYLAGGKL